MCVTRTMMTTLHCIMLQDEDTSSLFRSYSNSMRRSIPATTITNIPHFSLASQYGHTDVVRLLLDYNADLYAHDKDGDTPLHLSAGCGQLETTQMLLERGAEVNSQGQLGVDPITPSSTTLGRRKVRHSNYAALARPWRGCAGTQQWGKDCI
jgi:ankyrin repeat protein